MLPFRSLRRIVLLTMGLLSACAATGPNSSPAPGHGPTAPTGAFSAFLVGRHALADADYRRAADALLVALAANPDNLELRYQTFTATLIAGRPEAVPIARSLGDHPIARLLLASQEARAGRWRQAERLCTELPQTGPMQIVQPVLVAWARQGAGHTEEALAGIKTAIEQHGPRELLPLHAALIADVAGNREEAERFYQLAAADRSAMNVRVAYLLANWYLRTARSEAAQALFAQIQAAVPDAELMIPNLAASTSRVVASPVDGVAEVFLALGSALRSANTNDLALMILALALELRPDFAAARLAMSDIHLSRQHVAVALDVLAPVPGQDVFAPMVELRRAALLDREGRTDEAISRLRAMASAHPRSPVPDRHLGDILRARSRFREAVEAYDRAIARLPAITPSDWVLFYNRGVSLDRDGQWEKAEADFEQALKLAPDQPYALNYLAYSWTERGRNLERAQAMLERALRARPNDGAIIDSLGWVLFRMGRTREATRLLERAIELEPDDPTINSHLGDAYWAVGRRIEALYQWRRALTLNPPPEEAAQLEEKIRPGYSGPSPVSR